MDADSEIEKKKIDAVQTIETIQSMIDVSAERLEGLRTQCSTSAELTQQEIRTLEVGATNMYLNSNSMLKSGVLEFASRKAFCFKDCVSLKDWGE